MSGVKVPISQDLLNDSLYDINGYLMKRCRDRFRLLDADRCHTHPRVCDMETASGRKAAWDMFFKYGKVWPLSG